MTFTSVYVMVYECSPNFSRRSPPRTAPTATSSWSARPGRGATPARRSSRSTGPATGSVTLRLRPNRSWQGFRAGQFIRLGVEIDGVRETRCYSPACSEQTEGEIEITIRAHPEGLVSNHLHEHARPGHVRRALGGRGRLHPLRARPERLLLISGGSGITPVISMLRTLCDEGHRRRDRLPSLLAVARVRRSTARSSRRSPRAHPNVRILHAHTRTPGAGDLDGHLCREHLGPRSATRLDADAYVCGPPAPDRGGARDLHRGRRSRRAFTSRASCRRRWRSPPTRPRAPCTSPAPASASPTTAAPCSSRPRRPGSAPSSAAGWASATRAPARRRRAASATSHRRGLDDRGRGDPDLRLGPGRRRRTTNLMRRPMTTT